MTTPGPQNPLGAPPDGGRPHSGSPTTPSDRRAGATGVRSNVPLAVVGLVLGVLMSVLDQTIVTIALRDITTDLGGTGSAGWVVTAYVLASTATATLYGRLSDRYGRRAVYLAAVAAFTAASALCGLAQDMPQLVTARAIQGAGAGALFAVPAIALAELFPDRLRARVQGAVGAVFALAAVGGPLVGGALTDAAGWRWIFYVNVPIGLLSILLVATSLRLPRPQADPRLDVPGAILLAGAAVSLVLLTGRPDRYGLIALTAALFAAFWWRERRAESPIIPPRLFEERALRVVFPATALLGVLLYGSIVFLPTYLQVAFGLNATEAGLAGNPYFIPFIAASALAGGLRPRTSVLIGALLIIPGLLLLGRADLTSPYAYVAAGMAVLGAGFGLVMQNLVTLAQNAARPADLGAVTSAVLSVRGFGMAAGVALSGGLLGDGPPRSLAAAVPGALLWGLVPATALLVLLATLPRKD